jgi:Protein of unknown function (DUF3617)
MTARAVSVSAAVLALSIAAFAQGPRRDGNWEVKMEMQMAGMPPGMPPFTSTQCITPEEAKDPDKLVPQGRGRGRGRGNQDCKVSDYKLEGNKATWSMKCEGEQPMTGTGEFLYSADTYTGTIKMDTGRGAMTMKYSGKRLGDCVK